MVTLKFMCHKVLPLVYEDSLSYYEVLCKVVAKVNEIIENQHDWSEEIQALTTLVNSFDSRISTNTSNITARYNECIMYIDNAIDDIEESLHEPATFASGGIAGKMLAVGNNGKLKWVDAPQSLPAGGSNGQVLRKIGATDYEVGWSNERSLPAGGTLGQVLMKADNQDYNFSWGTVTPEGSIPEDRLIPAGGSVNQVLKKSGVDDYDVAWGNAPSGIPSGGTTGQIIVKQSNTDGDIDWEDSPVGIPTGGSAGAVLAKASSTPRDVEWVSVDNEPVEESDNLISSGAVYDVTQTIHSVPSGGASGKVLAKASGADYDLAWVDAGSGGGTADKHLFITVIDNDFDPHVTSLVGKGSIQFNLDEPINLANYKYAKMRVNAEGDYAFLTEGSTNVVSFSFYGLLNGGEDAVDLGSMPCASNENNTKTCGFEVLYDSRTKMRHETGAVGYILDDKTNNEMGLYTTWRQSGDITRELGDHLGKDETLDTITIAPLSTTSSQHSIHALTIELWFIRDSLDVEVN